MKLSSLELFSGMGGLAKGLTNSGFVHSRLVEFNKHACATLRLNFDDQIVFEGDIRDFSFSGCGSIDVIAGGPPCQPFSLGGKHKAYSDNRDMFPYAISAIEKLKPKAFVFENVKGLLRNSFSNYFEYILLRLQLPEIQSGSGESWREHLTVLRDSAKAGLCYDVSFKLINAANYGVPQCRERVFIIGIRSDLNKEWHFPDETHSKDALIYEQSVNGAYWTRHNIEADLSLVKPFKGKGEFDQSSLFYEPLKPWVTVRDALSHLPDPLSAHDIKDHTFRGGARSYPGHTGSYYDLPSKTLKAGVHGVPGGENMIRYSNGTIRYLTVHEAKLTQTFPRDFEISGAWGEAMRQIGNAVPVTLAEILGKQLRKTLAGNALDYNRKANNLESSFRIEAANQHIVTI